MEATQQLIFAETPFVAWIKKTGQTVLSIHHLIEKAVIAQRLASEQSPSREEILNILSED